MASSAGFLSITWPLVIVLAFSFAIACWVSLRGEAWVYNHTGRSVLAWLYGIFIFFALFFFLIVMSFSFVTGFLEGSSGKDSVVLLIMVGGAVALPLTGLFLVIEVFATFWKIHVLRLKTVPQIKGFRRFLYSAPLLLLIGITSLFLVPLAI